MVYMKLKLRLRPAKAGFAMVTRKHPRKQQQRRLYACTQ